MSEFSLIILKELFINQVYWVSSFYNYYRKQTPIKKLVSLKKSYNAFFIL